LLPPKFKIGQNLSALCRLWESVAEATAVAEGEGAAAGGAMVLGGVRSLATSSQALTQLSSSIGVPEGMVEFLICDYTTY
jgi:hypothetical protein